MDRGARRIAIAAVGTWALVACFFRLGESPVVISNEAREGVYVRAMLRSGDFVAPLVANHVENDEIIPDKPPLFHWVAAAATVLRSLLSGGPTAPGPELSRQFDEWALRFPSALFASVLVISVAVLGAGLVGDRGALCAAAVLLTSAQFGYQARFGRVDMTLACFASLAALLAGRALLDPHEVRRVPFVGAATGLAVLAKGPLGAVLTALACGSALAVRRTRKRAAAVSEKALWRAALVTLVVVALPWYVVASVARGGAVLRSHIFAENFVQFAGLGGRMNEFFYLWPWLLDSFPWNLFAVAGLFEAWRRREPGPRFCALWWISWLAFFQIAAYKRRAYLLPALPAEALLAGWFIDVALMRGLAFASIDPSALVRRLARPALLCLTVAVVGALIAPRLHRIWIGDAAMLRLDGDLARRAGACASAAGGESLVRARRRLDRARLFLCRCRSDRHRGDRQTPLDEDVGRAHRSSPPRGQPADAVRNRPGPEPPHHLVLSRLGSTRGLVRRPRLRDRRLHRLVSHRGARMVADAAKRRRTAALARASAWRIDGLEPPLGCRIGRASRLGGPAWRRSFCGEVARPIRRRRGHPTLDRQPY
jgi:4-amino-4-deoxy-L-arabinose transferase-like glycosyltransferase